MCGHGATMRRHLKGNITLVEMLIDDFDLDQTAIRSPGCQLRLPPEPDRR